MHQQLMKKSKNSTANLERSGNHKKDTHLANVRTTSQRPTLNDGQERARKAPAPKYSLKTPSPCSTFCKLRWTWGWLSEPQSLVAGKIGKLPWSWNHGTLWFIENYTWIPWIWMNISGWHRGPVCQWKSYTIIFTCQTLILKRSLVRKLLSYGLLNNRRIRKKRNTKE